MFTKVQTLPIAALAGLLLSGCAGASDAYPSLAIRDAERISGEFTPVEPETPAPAPVASPQDIAAILAQANELNRKFVSEQSQARQIIGSANGAGLESAAYARALVALASLTSLRGQTAIALSNLDELRAEAGMTFAPDADIRVAQAEVAMLVAEQTTAIDSLAATLPSPTKGDR